jgi:hypothetical protein
VFAEVRNLPAGHEDDLILATRGWCFPSAKPTPAASPGVAIAAAALLSHDLGGWHTPTVQQAMGWVIRIGAPVSRAVSDHTTFRVHGFSMYADAHLWRGW